ncbi:translation initiation factor IF-5A [Candidatus Woesearchaeota archaeon]|nr:translation initiation factor IF-5A [Candidatus Woesearchaeota archaeon]
MVLSEKKLVTVGTLKEGNLVILDDQACKIVDVKVSKPGKHGHAKVNLTAVGLLDSKKRNVVMPGHDNIEVPIIDKRSAQVLSITGDVANVMDAETFETFDLKIPEELKGACVEGCNVLYWIIMNERIMKQIKTE